ARPGAAVLRGLEQKRAGAPGGELAVDPDRRLGVGEHPADHRDDPAVRGELMELGTGGADRAHPGRWARAVDHADHVGDSAGSADKLGERIVRTFLSTWDSTGGGHFTALVRSVSGHEQAAHLLHDFFVKQVFTRVASAVTEDRVQFRGSLVGSQMVGMGMARYVLKFEPMASADIETIVAAVAPNVQRYLTGDLD